MQLWKLKAKMDFYLAKHGLNKHGISEDQIWSPKRKRETVEREGERREEEEEDGGAKIKANKLWNFGFLYGN